MLILSPVSSFYINQLLLLYCLSYSVVQSFEVVISLYAQQLSLNETQNFTSPSLTLVAELVSIHSALLASSYSYVY